MITNTEKIKIIKRAQRELNAKYKKVAKASDLQEPMHVLIASALGANPFAPEAKRAIRAMEKAYVDWNEARVTRAPEIAEHLTPHGIPGSRANHLKKILSGLFDHFNAVNLDFIEKLDPNPIRNRMQRIEDLKPEEIDNILLLSFGVNVLPLNAHVQRIFQRIGIIKKDTSPTAGHSLFKSALGKAAVAGFYERVNLLGEKICTTSQPACNTCPLKLECIYGLVKRGLLTESEAEFPLPADIRKRTPKRAAAKKTRKKAKPKKAATRKK